MCSPAVINDVQREFSRRRFIAATALGTAGVMLAADAAGAQQAPIRLSKGFRAVHDLTHLHQLTRVMAHQYREDVGPFLGPGQVFHVRSPGFSLSKQLPTSEPVRFAPLHRPAGLARAAPGSCGHWSGALRC